MHLYRAVFVGIAALIFSAGVAVAKPVVRLQLTGEKIQTLAAGRIKLVPVQAAGVLRSGDRIRYTIDAVNTGDQSAIDLATVGPIPKRMKYVGGSAKAIPGTTVQYSVDGRHWSSKPMLAVRTAAGIKEKPADPSSYTSVRWVAKRILPPKASFHYAYEVVVR